MVDLPEPAFEVVTVGPCQYRKLVLGDDIPPILRREARYEEGYEEEEDRPDIPLEYEGSEWVHKMEVMEVMFKFLIGKGGKSKQRLEQDSGASIYIPDKGSKDKRITIKAGAKHDVYSAVAQIELLLEKEEEKMDYTHYFAIPLKVDNFDKFKDAVLREEYPTFGPLLFQRADRLHFTLCMLRIHSDEQMQRVMAIATEWENELKKDDLVAHCVGLHYMNDDPREVDVVFTTDTSDELLRKINTKLDHLYRVLMDNRLITQASLHKQRLLSTERTAEIKLHATVLNSKWWPEGGTMDCRELLKKFRNYEFGRIPLNAVNIVPR